MSTRTTLALLDVEDQISAVQDLAIENGILWVVRVLGNLEGRGSLDPLLRDWLTDVCEGKPLRR